MDIFDVYLAGGMTAFVKNPLEMLMWRINVKNKLENYQGMYRVRCCNPVDYYNIPDTTNDIEEEAMLYDLHRLRKSDLVIVNFNDPRSLGTQSELAIAYENRIPIVGLNEKNNKLHPWQEIMCNKIFTSEDDMCDYIGQYYLA